MFIMFFNSCFFYTPEEHFEYKGDNSSDWDDNKIDSEGHF